ncbi:MAG: PucR family transcriptional regulator [Candidatus Dormibacteraceae bacterium]
MEQSRPTAPPTVREAMRSGGLRRATLVAGREGLGRPIEWVRVMETPEIVARMGPHELLLTAAYAMRGDPQAPARLVGDLARIESAGLVVTLGRYLDRLPPEMVAAADLHRVPLFTVAGEDVSRTELMEPLLERIMFAEHWRLKRSIEIHRRFTDLVLDGKGILAICATLAEIVDSPVTIEDATFHLLAHSGEPTDDPHRQETIAARGSPRAAIFDPRFQRALREVERRRGPTFVPALPHLGMRRERIIAPIQAGRQVLGYLSILGPIGEGNQELAMMAIEQAALVVAIELTKERELAEVEDRVRGEFLDELVQGTYGDLATARRRARHLGYRLEGGHVLLVCDIDRFRDYLDRQHLGEEAIQALKRELLGQVSGAVRASNPRALFLLTSDSVIVLASLGDATDAPRRGTQIGGRVQEAVARWNPGFTVSVASSDLVEVPSGVAAAHREVRGVLDTLARLGTRGRVVGVADLGLTALLAGIPDRRLEAFSGRHLSALRQHDLEHGGALVATLRAYLEKGEQQAAARSLDIHPNTLRYRLERVRAIAGVDLDDPETRLNLAVALQVQALLDR